MRAPRAFERSVQESVTVREHAGYDPLAAGGAAESFAGIAAEAGADGVVGVDMVPSVGAAGGVIVLSVVVAGALGVVVDVCGSAGVVPGAGAGAGAGAGVVCASAGVAASARAASISIFIEGLLKKWAAILLHGPPTPRAALGSITRPNRARSRRSGRCG